MSEGSRRDGGVVPASGTTRDFSWRDNTSCLVKRAQQGLFCPQQAEACWAWTGSSVLTCFYRDALGSTLGSTLGPSITIGEDRRPSLGPGAGGRGASRTEEHFLCTSCKTESCPGLEPAPFPDVYCRALWLNHCLPFNSIIAHFIHVH